MGKANCYIYLFLILAIKRYQPTHTENSDDIVEAELHEDSFPMDQVSLSPTSVVTSTTYLPPVSQSIQALFKTSVEASLPDELVTVNPGPSLNTVGSQKGLLLSINSLGVLRASPLICKLSRLTAYIFWQRTN